MTVEHGFRVVIVGSRAAENQSAIRYANDRCCAQADYRWREWRIHASVLAGEKACSKSIVPLEASGSVIFRGLGRGSSCFPQ